MYALQQAYKTQNTLQQDPCVPPPRVVYYLYDQPTEARQPMSDSYVEVSQRGVVSYVGPDATNLARAILLKSALTGWAKFRMIPTRNVTITSMLQNRYDLHALAAVLHG